MLILNYKHVRTAGFRVCTVYSEPGWVVGEGVPESRVVRNTFETLLVLGNSTLPSENEAICNFYQDQISRAGRQDSLGLNKVQ